MTDDSQPISRRGLFKALVRPFSQHLENLKQSGEEVAGDPDSPATPQSANDENIPKEAVIQGRFCLAYQGGICFTCSERCPVPGAISTKLGIPTVHRDLCTGCGICHDLCPAPKNAILMLDRQDAASV